MNQDSLIDNELFDVFSSHELGVSIVNDLIDNLVYQHEVLPYALLIEHSTVVSEDLHHSIQDVHHERRRHIVLGCCYEEDAELLRVEEVNAFHVLGVRGK